MPLPINEAKPSSIVLSSTEPVTKLAKNIFVRKEELIAALSTADFYIQLFVIGISLSLAWLMAMLIEKRLRSHFLAHPPKRIDIEFVIRPLGLLAPILALIYLGVLKPIADEFSVDGDWTAAAIQMSFAYLLAKCVLLIVRSRLVANFIAFVIMLMAGLSASGLTGVIITYLNGMSIQVGQFRISMLSFFHGIVILVVVFWIAGLLSRTLESYLRRSSTLSYTARELTVKFFRIFIYFLALIITLSVMGVDLTAFAVFGGALGVGIGLGLQKLTSNFVSGITLLMEKSIRIGDLIEVGGNTGWVRQLNIRYALIQIPDGREVMIPNEELVSTRVTNWTHTSNTARIDIKVNVAYNCDPIKVRELMVEAAREHLLCLKTPEPSCHLREFGDSALQFVLIFWIPDVHDGRMGPQSDVMISILEKFKKAGIGIPCVASNNKTENIL